MRYYATTDHDGCPYITAGKRYEIEECMDDGEAFTIFADRENDIYCIPNECAHLDGNNWKIGIIREDK